MSTTHLELVTVSELKQSPAKVLDRAKKTGKPIPIVRNNQIEGYFVPVGAMKLIDASADEMEAAFESVLERYGDSITWLAKN